MSSDEEFKARKGDLRRIVSERGSQLISASQVLASKETADKWDREKIKANNSASIWKFVPIGCQHYNGLP